MFLSWPITRLIAFILLVIAAILLALTDVDLRDCLSLACCGLATLCLDPHRAP